MLNPVEEHTMKRKLTDSINMNEGSRKKRRTVANHNHQNIKTNHCKYWKMEESFTPNRLWIIYKLLLSRNLDRIGLVLSRKTSNKFKIMIIETNMIKSCNTDNIKHRLIWSQQGTIPYLNHIVFDDKLCICIVAHKCNDIDLYHITNAHTVSLQNMSVNHSKYSDPDVAWIAIFNNNMLLITKRGMLHQRPLNEYDNKDHHPLNQLVSTHINAIYGNGSKYIILSRVTTENKMSIVNHDGSTKYDIKHRLKALRTTEIKSVIAEPSLNRMILSSIDSIYCLDIDQKKIKDTQNVNHHKTTIEQHNNGSISFDVNRPENAPKTVCFQSNVIFKQRISSKIRINDFYDSDTVIGYDENILIMWRICNPQQTKQVITRTALVFDGLICGIIAQFISQIPQQLIIRFIDHNKQQFTIDGVNAKNGVIILCDADNQKIAFKLDYLMILNEANNSKCLHIFTVALPIIN